MSNTMGNTASRRAAIRGLGTRLRRVANRFDAYTLEAFNPQFPHGRGRRRA
ncbi:hypothetical protein [Gandjariella thermophila]|uniref:Uncharacterized protein n=1 Tax=Gandjariella thermophila TaxID=1931992 RepID=A0A4D4JCP6_9PSEU|nr:hypothetical protein [Gandjariella thermophila]GDY32428.1 hypothetical protein GTS_40610 [Gandjariella thermophila]